MTDELHDRLRASDPAASLPPADPERVARLLEDVMSTELTTENRATGTRNRSTLTWLVAAAATVIIAAAGLCAVTGLNGDDPDRPAVSDGAPVSDPTVTELEAPGTAAYNAKCMVPNAEALSRQTLAFDGTVTSISDGLVTLAPSTWYAGTPTDLVQVRAPAEDWQRLLSAVRFEEGGRYLVSATDGRVTVCGFSAPYSPDLAAIYAAAFSA